MDVLLLALIVAAAYLPSLWNGFVYDDGAYIIQNPLLQQSLDLKKIFSETYAPNRADQGLYRPLVTLSYWVDHALWGFPAQGHFNGFHLTNLLLHALNSILFLFVLRTLGITPNTSLFCAIIFAIHPASSEAVAWVVGRAELMGLTLGLLSALAYLRHPTWKGYLLAIGWWIGAMLSKEQWVFLPLAFATLQVGTRESPHIPRARLWRQVLLSILFLGAFWTLRSWLIGGWKPALTTYEGVVTPLQRIWTALELMWHYVWIWFFPMNLSVQHAIAPVESALRGLFAAAAWIFVFWGAWQGRTFFPWLLWALGWFWALMLAVSNLLIPIGTPFAERFLYPSTLFFAPMVVLSVRKLLDWMEKPSLARERGWMLALPLFALLLFRLENRLSDWKSNLTLWESAYLLYPQSFAVKAPLAETLLFEGRFGEAHILASETVRQLEHQPGIYQKLFLPRMMRIDGMAQSGMRQIAWMKRFVTANENAQSFRTQEALVEYLKLADEFPEQPQTFEALGSIYLRLENFEGARQSLEEAIRLGSKSPALFAQDAYVLSQLGRKAEAILMYDEALKLDPKAYPIHSSRARVLADIDDYQGALTGFREVTRLAPFLPEGHVSVASILIHLQQYGEAEKELSQVLKLNPDHPEARELLRKIPNIRMPPPPK